MSGKNAACWTPRPALPLRVPLACSLKEPEAFPFLSLCEGVAPFRHRAAPLRGPQSPQTYSRDWRAAGSRQRWPARPLWAPVAETRTAPTARLPHPRGGPTSGSSWTRLLCLLEERVSRRQAYGRGKSPFLRQNAVSEALATSGPPDGSCASHSDTGLSSATFPTPWETDPSQGLGGGLVTGWIKP